MDNKESLPNVLDADVSELIGSIRVSKESKKIQYEIIRCPVCGTDSGRLGKSKKAFCPECLTEFNISGEPTKNPKEDAEPEYVICVSCGKRKTRANVKKDGKCTLCTALENNYTLGKCRYCGKESHVHKKTGLCYYHQCNRKGLHLDEQK